MNRVVDLSSWKGVMFNINMAISFATQKWQQL